MRIARLADLIMMMMMIVTVAILTLQPVLMASPADLERDRKAEDERRVQDMLAFLDEEEEGDSKTGDRSLALCFSILFHLSISMFSHFFLSLHLMFFCIFLFVSLPFSLSVFLSVPGCSVSFLFVSLPFSLSIFLSVPGCSVSFCLSLCLSVCLSFCLCLAVLYLSFLLSLFFFYTSPP